MLEIRRKQIISVGDGASTSPCWKLVAVNGGVEGAAPYERIVEGGRNGRTQFAPAPHQSWGPIKPPLGKGRWAELARLGGDEKMGERHPLSHLLASVQMTAPLAKGSLISVFGTR